MAQNLTVPNLTPEITAGSQRSLTGDQNAYKIQQALQAQSTAITALQPVHRYVSANYAVQPSDYLIIGRGTATITVTLPACKTVPDSIFRVKTYIASGTNGVLVAPTGSDTIDLASGAYGPLVQTTDESVLVFDFVTLQSDGISNWVVIGTSQ